MHGGDSAFVHFALAPSPKRSISTGISALILKKDRLFAMFATNVSVDGRSMNAGMNKVNKPD